MSIDLAAALPRRATKPLSPDEQFACEDILDAAHEWRAGRLPLEAFAKVGPLLYGGKPSCGYGRFRALFHSRDDDPRRGDLKAAIDELLSWEGVIHTTNGTFDRSDLGDVGAVIHPPKRVA